MLKAPFPLEEGWLRRFGYPGERRFVALFWEPCGDEACYDDGVSSACGLFDNAVHTGGAFRQSERRILTGRRLHGRRSEF